MTGQSNLYTSYNLCSGRQKVKIADGTLSSVAGKGRIPISKNLSLDHALHVPKFSCNLLSISKITKDLNCVAKFFPSYCEFQDMRTGKVIGTGKEIDGLYYFESESASSSNLSYTHLSSSNSSSNKEIELWHKRLGHPIFPYLKKLFPSLFKDKNHQDFQCEVCELAKHRVRFSAQPHKESQPFSLIHSDIWGPSRINNISGARWFITFIDDHTRVSWVYLLKEKSEAARTFQDFHKMIKTQFQANIQILHTDNGREYFSTILGSYLTNHGIVHHSSCVDTPQPNRIAERKNKHLLEVARALTFTMAVPKTFWGEAVLTATYLINRMPSRVLNFKTPLDTLKNLYPLSKLFCSLTPKVFGCVAFVHIHNQNRGKLDPRALRCVFLGYSPTQKGYKCYHPPTRKFFVLMDVTFFENTSFFPKTSLQGKTRHDKDEDMFWSTLDVVNSNTHESLFPSVSEDSSQPLAPNIFLNVPKPQENISSEMPKSSSSSVDHPNPNNSQPLSSPIETPFKCVQDRDYELKVYSRRNKIQPPQLHQSPLPSAENLENKGNSFVSNLQKNVDSVEFSDLDLPSCTLHPISNFVSCHMLSSSFKAFVTGMLSSYSVPRNIQEDLMIPKWREAVYEEMRALQKNDTWQLVNHPPEKKPAGCKWVFTTKHKADGTVERYKARLVAKGFSQTYGIDYQETFAPVVARSSAEAEFRAMAQGICELIWLKIFLMALHMVQKETMRLYCDNKAAISIAHNPVQHDRTKHIEIDRHFIKEKIESGQICIPYVTSRKQQVDVLTEGLPKKKIRSYWRN